MNYDTDPFTAAFTHFGAKTDRFGPSRLTENSKCVGIPFLLETCHWVPGVRNASPRCFNKLLDRSTDSMSGIWRARSSTTTGPTTKRHRRHLACLLSGPSLECANPTFEPLKEEIARRNSFQAKVIRRGREGSADNALRGRHRGGGIL